jgi:ParB-like chromosome segregation protein Spo0J
MSENKAKDRISFKKAKRLGLGQFVETRTVRVDDLKWNGCIFPRKALDKNHVAELAEIAPAFEGSPIVVDGRMRIVDGAHRYGALKQAQVEEIEVDVYQYKDDAQAIAHSIAINSSHGHQLTRDEKRDWGKTVWQGLKDTVRIATICGVSNRTVQRWMQEKLAQKKALRTQQIEESKKDGRKIEEIAAEIGVSERTIARTCQKRQMSKMAGSRRKKKQNKPKNALSSASVTSIPTDPISCVKAACSNLQAHDIPSLEATPPGAEQLLPRAAWSIAKLMQVLNDLAGDTDGRTKRKNELKKKARAKLKNVNGALANALSIAGVELPSAEETDDDNVIAIGVK